MFTAPGAVCRVQTKDTASSRRAEQSGALLTVFISDDAGASGHGDAVTRLTPNDQAPRCDPSIAVSQPSDTGIIP
jgi:hypothetical protein